MTLQKQIEHINNSLFAAKMANLIQYMYEDELKQALAAIFKHMREEITANLEEFYGDVLFNAHMDLILAPIHENHKKYYDTIMKYKLREHRKGRTQGKRLVERAQKYAIQYSKNTGAIKADDKIPLNSLIQKDKLFATSDFSAEQMRDKTFVASENTLSRVDKDINGIITDGYRDGLGINDVTNRVNTRFNQLESWEAQRIARTEIHGSHMMGVMNSYEDMGVEYLQWAAAHDNRTRDTHAKLDGEIISMGGIFSNGCRFPGDTNAPLSEVINCRCGVLPWFCPPGAMVPVGMSNFRESDLIPLGRYGNEDLLKKYESDHVDKVLNQLESRSNEWDIYRLTPGERDVYIKAKKNYTILDDAIKNKNYSRLNDLEDDPMMFIRNKETFMTNTDNLTDFSLVKEEMAEYLEDILDYEKIIKDKNIEVDITPRKIEWKNKDLNNGLWVNLDKKTGEYTVFNPDEKFIAYKFKKEGLTIKESVDTEYSQVRALYKEYKKLPELLQNTDEIVLSNQYIVDKASVGKSVFNLHKSIYEGYVLEGEGTRIVSFNKPLSKTVGTVIHEATHNLEKELLYYVSNSDEYVLAFKKDQKRLLDMGKELEKTYVTPYAQGFTETAINGGENAYRAYSEDLAESMKEYLKNKEKFTKDYPEKAKVLEKILKGEFKPETTTSYKEFYKIESKRFRPTYEEMEKAQEIRWKQTDLAQEGKGLSKLERDELQSFDDKQMLNYLHNKKITGETLPDNEEKVYKELYKKFTNKNPIMEQKSGQLTEIQIKQELSKLSEREKLKELKQTLDKGQTKAYTQLMSELKRTSPSSKKYKEVQAKIFEYDKLLFKPKNKVPEIDITKFKMDEQVGEVHTIKNTILEKKQIDIQNKINLTMAEESDLHAYGGKPHAYINGFLKKNDDWDKFVLDMSSKGYSEEELIKGSNSLRGMEDIISNMDSAMVKSSGLTQDTVIFSGTEFDGTLRAGDFSSFTEYRSCSYQYDSAESFKIGNPDRYMVKIYAPEGQKGIAMNAKMSDGNRLGFYSHEHEFLLPRDQEFQVIDVDHFNKQATILLI